MKIESKRFSKQREHGPRKLEDDGSAARSKRSLKSAALSRWWTPTLAPEQASMASYIAGNSRSMSRALRTGPTLGATVS